MRLALGAHPRDVLTMVMVEGMRLSVTGAAIGVVAALAAGRTLTGLLFGVAATDPATFAIVAAALISVTLCACYLPARRAMAVEPITALRME